METENFKAEIAGLIVREMDNFAGDIATYNDGRPTAQEIKAINYALRIGGQDLILKVKNGKSTLYAGRAPWCECCGNYLTACDCTLYAGRAPGCECCGNYLTACDCFGGMKELPAAGPFIAKLELERSLGSIPFMGDGKCEAKNGAAKDAFPCAAPAPSISIAGPDYQDSDFDDGPLELSDEEITGKTGAQVRAELAEAKRR